METQTPATAHARPATSQLQAQTRAVADYQQALGTIIDAGWVYGYVGDDSVEYQCDPPAKVRVLDTLPGDVQHWCDEYLDPYWNVELAEPHPAITDAPRSLWTFGPSYRLTTPR